MVINLLLISSLNVSRAIYAVFNRYRENKLVTNLLLFMYIKLLKHMYKAPALPSVFCAYGNDAGKGEGDGDVHVGWLLWG